MGESPGKMYALSAVLMVIAMAAVPIRFYARQYKHVRLGWDDWMILPALLFTILTGISIIIGAAAGDLGRHTQIVDGQAVPTARTAVFQKVSYYTLLTQTLTFGFTKLAVLLFYKRIFRGRAFKITVWIAIVIIIMWTIAFFFANLFQCVPIWVNWVGEGVTDQNCIEETNMYLGQAWSDVFTDVAILSLPMPWLWRLQMPLSQKIAVSCIFLLGALVVAAGVAKLVVFHGIAIQFNSGNQDLTYFLTPVLYWPMVESSLGILGACLPTYRPLFSGVSLDSIIASVRSTLSLQSLSSRGSRSQRATARTQTDNGSQSSNVGLNQGSIAQSSNGANGAKHRTEYNAKAEFVPMGHVDRPQGVPQGGILESRDFHVDGADVERAGT